MNVITECKTARFLVNFLWLCSLSIKAMYAEDYTNCFAFKKSMCGKFLSNRITLWRQADRQINIYRRTTSTIVLVLTEKTYWGYDKKYTSVQKLRYNLTTQEREVGWKYLLKNDWWCFTLF